MSSNSFIPTVTLNSGVGNTLPSCMTVSKCLKCTKIYDSGLKCPYCELEEKNRIIDGLNLTVKMIKHLIEFDESSDEED